MGAVWCHAQDPTTLKYYWAKRSRLDRSHGSVVFTWTQMALSPIGQWKQERECNAIFGVDRFRGERSSVGRLAKQGSLVCLTTVHVFCSHETFLPSVWFPMSFVSLHAMKFPSADLPSSLSIGDDSSSLKFLLRESFWSFWNYDGTVSHHKTTPICCLKEFHWILGRFQINYRQSVMMVGRGWRHEWEAQNPPEFVHGAELLRILSQSSCEKTSKISDSGPSHVCRAPNNVHLGKHAYESSDVTADLSSSFCHQLTSHHFCLSG